MTKANPHIEKMAPYALADLEHQSATSTVSLAQNENPWPPTERVIQSLDSDWLGHAAAAYPDPDWCELRSAIAENHGIDSSAILCGAGSMELIACIMQAFAGPEDEVLSTQYAYAFFQTAAQTSGSSYKAVSETGFHVDIDAILEGVSKKTKIVCVANPGNPTGTHIPNSEIRRLRANLHEDVILIADEAYGEFLQHQDGFLFDLASEGNTIILRTFSKAYALAGMRVGWGVFPGTIAGEVRKVLNPNNIPSISQKAATVAVADQDAMKRNCMKIGEIRDWFSSELQALGFEVPASHTNFVLVPFSAGETAAAADRALREAGIIVRGMGGYGLPQCLRVTIGDTHTMKSVLSVLENGGFSNA